MDAALDVAGDPVAPAWSLVRAEAEAAAAAEALLGPVMGAQVLRHASFEAALAAILATRLHSAWFDAAAVRGVVLQALGDDGGIARDVVSDLAAIRDRDPACEGLLAPLLFYEGLHALAAHRVNHWLWQRGRRTLARLMQAAVAQALAVDIHPAARIGRGILLDHAHGVVIGETAVVEDDVSMLHNVTLGGTGKHSGDRHPKVRSGVLLGAGALILGGIEIGRGAKVGAGAVVLREVPPHTTVAGNPARLVGNPATPVPSLEMNHLVEPAPAVSLAVVDPKQAA